MALNLSRPTLSLCVSLMLLTTDAIAALHLDSDGVQSRVISLCFVGDAVAGRADRVQQIRTYIRAFEHAANIKFNYLGACPAPTTQNGNHYHQGDVRVVLPNTNVNATIPIPGLGCPREVTTFKSDPECISRKIDIIDCFARGAHHGAHDDNDRLWQKFGVLKTGYSDYNVEWTEWSDGGLGGTLTSGAGVASWASDRVDVFIRGADNALWHKWWDGSQWWDWQSLDGSLTSDPDAVSWGPNRIDVFARGEDNAIWHRWWEDSQWRGWESLGGSLTSGPTVASWEAGRLDVFARGQDAALWHKWWDGSQWSNWQSLGGVLTSDPDAVSWGPNRIDVFARGEDNAIWHRWWDDSQWRGWESLGGSLTSGPTVASWGTGRLDVFARGQDGGLWHKWWDGSQWRDWQSLGGNGGWGSWGRVILRTDLDRAFNKDHILRVKDAGMELKCDYESALTE